MDEMEQKETLEQEGEQEGVHAESAPEMIEEETQPPAEEMPETDEVGDSTEPIPEEGKQEESEGNYVLGIIIGLAIFCAVLASCWMLPGGENVQNTGVLYAKDNNLYFYDLKNDPYLLQEGISEGGSYHYFYTAWGAGCAEEGRWAYFSDNIDETGAFDLYRKDTKNAAAKAEQIDTNVYDYMISKDGETVAYLKGKDEAMELRTYQGTRAQTVKDGIHLENEVYTLSGDGRHLAFIDAYGMLNAAVVGANNVQPLTDTAQSYAIAEKSGILYFVAKGTESYELYSYAFNGSDPILVADNIYTMEMMPNGRDVLYCKTPDAPVLYSDIIVDDMAEADAALTEANGEEYEKKLQRDTIRKAVANGEGFAPLLQDCYVLKGGKSVLIAEDVVSAISAAHDRPYVVGYKAKEFTPLHLSVIDGGLDMVEYIYYMSLTYGGLETFFADAAGHVQTIPGGQIQPDSIKISANGKRAAYLESDPDTGETVLKELQIGKNTDAAAVQKNVASFDYVGETDWLGYYFDYADGQGTLRMADSSAVENVCGVQFAPDQRAIYYIQNPDAAGNGDLYCWQNRDHWEKIDENVFAFQYKANGRLVYFKNYDVNTGLGDLYYYDRTTSHLLDTDVTALFVY